MGILKKIHGICDPETEQKVEHDLEQIESGQVTKIYPIFKPGDWMGVKKGAVHQTLVGTHERPILVVAFGYDAPNSFVFLMQRDVEGKDQNQILQQAYDNLEEVESEFKILEVPGQRVLISSGNFSSEKILCRNHMLKAHEMLQAKELLVSIPRRSCMLAASKQADEEFLKTVIHLHHSAWVDNTFGNPHILNALLAVTDGRIHEIFPIHEE